MDQCYATNICLLGRNKNDIAASLNKCATVPSEWSQTEEVICVGVLHVCAMLQYHDAGTYIL